MFRKRQGFTLIELLIVVAIIAILAAIAVPNFLEAQTRAKVSRCKTDMRTMAVGEEAYYVDYNSYTQGVGGGQYPINYQGFIMLTTPVAYLTSIPLDPFGNTRFNGNLRLNNYELGSGSRDGSSGRNPNDPGPGWPADVFEIEGDGPDHNDDTGGNGVLPSTGGFPTSWANLSSADMANGFYDPTNGTVSSGEIFRVGGVPTFPSIQVLFTMAQR